MISSRMVRVKLVLLAVFLGAVLSLTFPPIAKAQLGKPEGLYYKSWAIGLN